MATLALTVAGGLIGGPIGAAIGGLIGNAADDALLRPKAREGPRLTELRVQTSSYGTQIPQLFGTMRVAGSVIWATDLIEHRSSQGGGKGRPGTTAYTYTASFAVALSARRIVEVRRIWADGKLLRGAAGDFKTRTGFRLHRGGEDQLPDPLIASAEGIGLAPAHRGIAYAVFEDLELADFGNRIPSLSLEVVADPAAVPMSAIVEALGGAAVADAVLPALPGFAASGSSARAVLETLAEAAGGWFRDEGAVPALVAGEGAAIPLEDEGYAAEREAGATGERTIAASDSAPRVVTLAHYDPERDYQAGLQRAARPGPGMRELRVEMPAALSPAQAKGMAEAALAWLDHGRERRAIALPPGAMAIRPGDRVAIDGGAWVVDRWMLEDMVLRLECIALRPATAPARASGGRVLGAPDLVAGETVVAVFDLPALGAPLAAPRIGIAACGTGPGWRSAGLLLSTDSGASWSAAGATAAPAVIGTIASSPGAAPSAIADAQHRFVVALAHDAMMLGDADDAALAAGANLARVGDELLQFGRAEPMGGGRWRLGTLWRGRRGTEWAIGGQAAGDAFVLIDAETLAVRDLPAAMLGQDVQVLAQAAGDAEPVARGARVHGAGLVPPAPVHLRIEREGGGLRIDWVRRSRSGWDWIDGVDAPLAEQDEGFRVTLGFDAGEREVTVGSATLAIGADAVPGLRRVAVRQIGSHGLSRPATLELTTGDEP